MRMTYGDYALFKQGRGQFGTAEELKLPDLKWKTEDYMGGGQLGTRTLGLVLEALEIEAKLNSYEADIYGEALQAPGRSQNWRVMGSMIVPGEDEVPLKIEFTGALLDMSRDTMKPGAKTLATPKWKDVTYYKETVGGVTMYEIDLLNQILIVNGVDQMAIRRRNLGR